MFSEEIRETGFEAVIFSKERVLSDIGEPSGTVSFDVLNLKLKYGSNFKLYTPVDKFVICLVYNSNQLT